MKINLLHLSTDDLSCILLYLPVYDLIRLGFTCKNLYHVIHGSASLWKVSDLSPKPIWNDVSLRIFLFTLNSNVLQCIICIHIPFQTLITSDSVLLILELCPCLEKLNLKGCCMIDLNSLYHSLLDKDPLTLVLHRLEIEKTRMGESLIHSHLPFLLFFVIHSWICILSYNRILLVNLLNWM